MKSVLCFVVYTAVVSGVVLVPEETVVRHGFNVNPESSRSYESIDPSFGYNRPQSTKSGQSFMPVYSPASRGYGTSKYGVANHAYPALHKIASMDHDIKHQLASLEKKILAARPYFTDDPQILHEAEEQLRTLQHIQAGRLLHGIDSIRQLELQQEVLIHKVNAQLEDSVSQLKHTALLQHEISEKQKSVAKILLPESAVQASKKLTEQLHAIDEARSDGVDLSIAKDTLDREIAKEVVDHGIAREIALHQIAREYSSNPLKTLRADSRDQMLFPMSEHDVVNKDTLVDPRISVDQEVYSSKLSVTETVPEESYQGEYSIDRIDSNVNQHKDLDKPMVSEEEKSSSSQRMEPQHRHVTSQVTEIPDLPDAQ